MEEAAVLRWFPAMPAVVLSLVGVASLTSAAVLPTTLSPSSSWPQHCAYGTFDNDLVEQVVDNFVTKAEDIFEIPFTGAAGDYEYGPFTVFGSQPQRLKQRLCRCSDGDEHSFCVLYNTSLSVRVAWKRADSTPDTTKAINGTFRVDYQNTVLMIRFSVMDGAGNRVCITNVKVPFSEMKSAYAEDVSLASELSAIDRDEYAQVAVEADNALHLWLDEHIHVLGENTCFSLP